MHLARYIGCLLKGGRLGIRDRWTTWQLEIARRRKFDERSVGFVASVAGGCAVAGKFFAGVNGAGAVITASATISAYLSLATVDDKQICVASQFVSQSLRDGRFATLDFMAGGILALITASVPTTVLMWRNLRLHDLYKAHLKPLLPGMEFLGLSELTVAKICFFAQIVPIVVASYLFRSGLDYLFGPRLAHSASSIQSMWQTFIAACP